MFPVSVGGSTCSPGVTGRVLGAWGRPASLPLPSLPVTASRYTTQRTHARTRTRTHTHHASRQVWTPPRPPLSPRPARPRRHYVQCLVLCVNLLKQRACLARWRGATGNRPPDQWEARHAHTQGLHTHAHTHTRQPAPCTCLLPAAPRLALRRSPRPRQRPLPAAAAAILAVAPRRWLAREAGHGGGGGGGGRPVRRSARLSVTPARPPRHDSPLAVAARGTLPPGPPQHAAFTA